MTIETIGSLGLPDGAVIDRAYAEYTAWATLNTAIPYDDTIPQISEGVQVLSASITPKSPTNKLRITSNVPLCPNQSSNMNSAVFVNGGANAIAACNITTNALNHTVPSLIIYEYVPGTTATQTITVRAGPAAGATAYINGGNASRILGGAQRATLLVEEIKAS